EAVDLFEVGIELGVVGGPVGGVAEDVETFVFEAVCGLCLSGVGENGVGDRFVPAPVVEQGEDLRSELGQVSVGEREAEVEDRGGGHHRSQEGGVAGALVEAPAVVPLGEDDPVGEIDAAVQLDYGGAGTAGMPVAAVEPAM